MLDVARLALGFLWCCLSTVGQNSDAEGNLITTIGWGQRLRGMGINHERLTFSATPCSCAW